MVRTDALLPEITDRRRSQIEAALARIVESPEFRGSPRCIDFFSYAVRKWLDRDLASLKEKAIATEVFHKSSEYDPAVDSFDVGLLFRSLPVLGRESAAGAVLHSLASRQSGGA